MNRLQQLTSKGQSVWLDFTQRSFVASGELRRFIDEYGVTGVTSNPSIFDQAITETSDYAGAIEQAAARGYLSRDAYEYIIVQDIKAVAAQLEEEGLQRFVHSFDHLMSELERKLDFARKAPGKLSEPIHPQSTINQPFLGPTTRGDDGPLA